MSIINVPPHIDAIFDQPGREWTPAERRMVIDWLLEDRQFQYLLSFTLRRIGFGAREEDAEDTLQEFFTRQLDLEKKSDDSKLQEESDDPKSVFKHYDLGKGRRFWNYLLFCLEKFCGQEGKRISKRRYREQPMETQVETGEGEIIRLEVADKALDPEEALLQLEEEQERMHQIAVLSRYVNGLKPIYRQALVAHHIEEKPVVEIAAEAGIKEGNVKVRLFRARQELAECLRKEGLTL